VHHEGRGAMWTAGRRTVHLVYHENCLSEAIAIAREWQLKTHAKKSALINGDLAQLKSCPTRRIF
jgi:predicted GIY-YIG superfamily endonuclease